MSKYNAWSRRCTVSVAPPQSVDAAVKIEVPYFPGMAKYFNDVRFATQDGQEIPYWLESISYVDYEQKIPESAIYWIRLPANMRFFYVYYGNRAATTDAAADPLRVFDFFDDFVGNSINTNLWTVEGTGHSVSAGALTIQSNSGSGYIQSKRVWPVGYTVEIKESHAAGQRGPFGFRNNSTQKAAAWQGAAGSLKTDHCFGHNGTTGDWDNDFVQRTATWNIYGVEHLNSGPKFYVNGVFRRQITTYYPANASLPVQVYAYKNEGYQRVDWVRVRKTVSPIPTFTFLQGSHTVPQNNFMRNCGVLRVDDEIREEDGVSVAFSTTEKDGVRAPTRLMVTDDHAYGAPGEFQFVDQSTADVFVSESGTLIERTDLHDYPIERVFISEKIGDAYPQLNAAFLGSVAPAVGTIVRCFDQPKGPRGEPRGFATADGVGYLTADNIIYAFETLVGAYNRQEGSTWAPPGLATANGVYFSTADDVIYSFSMEETRRPLFVGRVVENDITFSAVEKTTDCVAAGFVGDLAACIVPPWLQNVDIEGVDRSKKLYTVIDSLLNELKKYTTSSPAKLEYYVIVPPTPVENQFVFSSNDTVFSALTEIMDFYELGFLSTTHVTDDQQHITTSCVVAPLSEIDVVSGKASLPRPETLERPDIDNVVEGAQIIYEKVYNSVTIRGVMENGTVIISTACTAGVVSGEESKNEILFEDPRPRTKEDIDNDAIRYLLYYCRARVSATVSFLGRCDFRLWQRLRFGGVYDSELQNLSEFDPIDRVYIFDPREPESTLVEIDVSGVPTPKWLRVSSYSIELTPAQTKTTLTLTTDHIRSSADEAVDEKYAKYIRNGIAYLDESKRDAVFEAVETTLAKQIQPQACTVLSINTDNHTALVQTSAGVLITVKLNI